MDSAWIILGELASDVAGLVHAAMNQRLTHEELMAELQTCGQKLETAVGSLRSRLKDNDTHADELLGRK